MSVVYDFVPRRLCRVQPPQTHAGRILHPGGDALPYGEITCCTVCSKRNVLCLGTSLGMLLVAVLQERDHAKLSIIGTHPGRVTCVAFYTNQHTRYLLSGGVDGTIKCWALQEHLTAGSGTCVQTLHAHDGTVTCLTAVGTSLLSGARDGKVLLWAPGPASALLRSPQLKPLAVVHQGSSWVRAITFDPPVRVGQPSWVFVADDAGHVLLLSQKMHGALHRPSSISFAVHDLSGPAAPAAVAAAVGPTIGSPSVRSSLVKAESPGAHTTSLITTTTSSIHSGPAAAAGGPHIAAAAAGVAVRGSTAGAAADTAEALRHSAEAALLLEEPGQHSTVCLPAAAAAPGDSSMSQLDTEATAISSCSGSRVQLQQEPTSGSTSSSSKHGSTAGRVSFVGGLDEVLGSQVSLSAGALIGSSSSSHSSGGAMAAAGASSLSVAASISGILASEATPAPSTSAAAEGTVLADPVATVPDEVAAGTTNGGVITPSLATNPSDSMSPAGHEQPGVSQSAAAAAAAVGSTCGVGSGNTGVLQTSQAGKSVAGRGTSYTTPSDPHSGSSSSSSNDSLSQLVVHHVRGITWLHYDAHDQLLVVAAYDGHIRVYNLMRPCLSRDWSNPNHCLFTCVVYDRHHRQVLAGDERGHLSVFDMEHDQCLITTPVTAAPLLALHPARGLGPAAYALVSRKGVELWEMQRGLSHCYIGGGHTKAVLAIHTASLHDLVDEQHLPDLRILSGGIDNRVLMWDPFDMSLLGATATGNSELSALTFHTAWGIMITGHEDGSIKLWNVDANTYHVLRGHNNMVTCLTLAPLRKTGHLLLSAGYDGMVCVWEVRHLHGDKPYLAAKFRAHGVQVTPADTKKGRRAPTAITGAMALAAAAARAAKTSAAAGGAKEDLGRNGSQGLEVSAFAGTFGSPRGAAASRGSTVSKDTQQQSPRWGGGPNTTHITAALYSTGGPVSAHSGASGGAGGSPRIAASQGSPLVAPQHYQHPEQQHQSLSPGSSSNSVLAAYQQGGLSANASGSSSSSQAAAAGRAKVVRPLLGIVDRLRSQLHRSNTLLGGRGEGAAPAATTTAATTAAAAAAVSRPDSIPQPSLRAASGHACGLLLSPADSLLPPPPTAASWGRRSAAGCLKQGRGPSPTKGAVLFVDPSQGTLRPGAEGVNSIKAWVPGSGSPAGAGSLSNTPRTRSQPMDQDAAQLDQTAAADRAQLSQSQKLLQVLYDDATAQPQQRQQQQQELLYQRATSAGRQQQQQQGQGQGQVPGVALCAPGTEPEVTAMLCDGVSGVIITGGNDATIRVWSASITGELLVCHQGHTGPVTALALDGNWLFSGSTDTEIHCWDLLPTEAKERMAGFGAADFAGPGTVPDADATGPAADSEPNSRGGSGSSSPASPGSPRPGSPGSSRSNSRSNSASLRPRSPGNNSTNSSMRPRSPLGARSTSARSNKTPRNNSSRSSSSRPSSPSDRPGGAELTGSTESQRTNHVRQRPGARRRRPSEEGAATSLSCSVMSRSLQTLSGHHKTVTGLVVLPVQGVLLSCGTDGQLIAWDYVAGAVVWKHEVEGLQIRCMGVRPDNLQVLLGSEESHIVTVDLHKVLAQLEQQKGLLE